MLWNKILIILAIEIVVAFALGKILIPYFRKIKTGKFEIYIGDRFKKDNSTPKFGGLIIAISLGVGLFLGISMISASFEIGEGVTSSWFISAFVFSVFVMIVGLFEDYIKEKHGKLIGLKLRYKVMAEYLLCLIFLLLLYLQGDKTQAVLLPFRWGYINFGVFYYPLMALFMTITINAVKLSDCFNGDVSSGIDGLCSTTVIVFSLIMAACCNIVNGSGAQVYAYCIAGAVAGFTVWGLSPAKIYLGESGSLLLGGLVSSLVILSQMHIIILFAGIAFLIDGVCSAIQYFVYRRSKKILFKGNSLHAHLMAKGWSDYKIIALFSLITILGGLAAIVFAVYKTKL